MHTYININTATAKSNPLIGKTSLKLEVSDAYLCNKYNAIYTYIHTYTMVLYLGFKLSLIIYICLRLLPFKNKYNEIYTCIHTYTKTYTQLQQNHNP